MIDALARLLGIRPDQTEDALRSERAARATLNRRGFLLAGATASAALATGVIFSLPAVEASGTLFLYADGTFRRSPATFDALLKERYVATGYMEILLYQPSPLFSFIPREAVQ